MNEDYTAFKLNPLLLSLNFRVVIKEVWLYCHLRWQLHVVYVWVSKCVAVPVLQATASRSCLRSPWWCRTRWRSWREPRRLLRFSRNSVHGGTLKRSDWTSVILLLVMFILNGVQITGCKASQETLARRDIEKFGVNSCYPVACCVNLNGVEICGCRVSQIKHCAWMDIKMLDVWSSFVCPVSPCCNIFNILRLVVILGRKGLLKWSNWMAVIFFICVNLKIVPWVHILPT